MNKINPKKLLNSKWTSRSPQQKEKHFLVVDVSFDEEQRVTQCVLEAVINKRPYEIDWRTLTDDSLWQFGWR